MQRAVLSWTVVEWQPLLGKCGAASIQVAELVDGYMQTPQRLSQDN